MVSARRPEAGLSLNFLGRTTEARAIYDDVIERSQRVFGPRSEATANAVAAAATADRRLGRMAEAERGYREAIAIYADINTGEDNVKGADQYAKTFHSGGCGGNDLFDGQAGHDTAFLSCGLLRLRLRDGGRDDVSCRLPAPVAVARILSRDRADRVDNCR
jgi:tetratricopeptide (TPR) repeat protein